MNDLPAVWHPHSFGMAILATVVFGLVGIVLALIGFKLFDLFTPFNLEKEMCENKNVAVGVLCGAIVLGVCIIVAAAIV
jgi:putative membrane protein